MLFILLFTFSVVLSSYLASTKVLKRGLEISFILIFLFSAFRYNYGNDYINYYRRFYEILNRAMAIHGPNFWDLYPEPGWTLLTLIMSPIGFEGMVFVLSSLTCLVYYIFIKKYLPIRLQWIGVTIYMLNPSFFWIPLSMMRQALVVVLFVAVHKYLIRKKLLIPILFFIVAISIHRTAYILFPLLFGGFLPHIKGKYMAVLFLILFLCLFNISLDYIYEFVGLYLIQNETVYGYMSSYGEGETSSMGIGAFINMIPFVVALYYFWESDTNNKWYFDKKYLYIIILATISHLITPLSLLNGWASRLGYYFSIFLIISIPISYQCIENKYMKMILLGILFLMYSYQYYLFFSDPAWAPFHQYHSILLK